MCENNVWFWYCIFLLIALSSEHQSNFTNDENENDYSTVQYQLDINVTINDEEDLVPYNLRENLNKDNNDTQYDRINTNNLKDEDLMYLAHVEKNENDSQMAIEVRSNSTELDKWKNFMSHEIHGNMNRVKNKNNSATHNFLENFNEDNIVLNKMCDNITCIRLCCPFGQHLVNGKCTAMLHTNFVLLPNMMTFIRNTLPVESKKLDKLSLFVHDPCQKIGHYSFDRSIQHIFLVNGSLYLVYYKAFIKPTSYCLAVVDQNKFFVNVCLDIMQKIMNNTINPVDTLATTKVSTLLIAIMLVQVGNMLILLVIFMVYSISELRNIQGFILRGYSGLLFIGHMVQLGNAVIKKETLGFSFFICIACAYVQYYCFVGWIFWLNILNFDMWCAFRKIRPLQRNIKQQERKKFIRYSLYAIGGPFMLTIICAIMDFAPDLSKSLIRPRFVYSNDFNLCWFSDMKANLLYLHGVKVICIIISIFLSICTSRKISHYKKDVVHYLKDLESRRFNDNEQWFKLTVRLTILLFIIICIRSYMFIAYSTYNEGSHVVSYTIIATEVIQNGCIFIIFVCKKKIMQLLLKRFRYWKHGNSRRTKMINTD